MHRIDSITAAAFRGIRSEVSIDLRGNHLLLYGENGFGKSSIIEALEHALTGDVASLSQRSQRISVKRHAPHILCPPGDMFTSAKLVDDKQRCTVSAGRATEEPDSMQLEAFLDGAADGTFILRRRQLLAFIEAPDDKSRYEMLRPFLRLDRFEAFEAAVKEASTSLTIGALKQQEALTQEESSLRKRFGLDADVEITHDVLVASAVSGVEESGFEASMLDKGDIPAMLRAAESFTGDPVALEHQLNLRRTCETWNDMVSAVAKTQETLAELLTATTDLESEEPDDRAFFERVLTEGRTWIEEDDLADCPLCEQSMDKTHVLERIAARLQEHSALIVARGNYQDSLTAFQESVQDLDAALRLSASKWKDAGLPEEEWPGSAIRSVLDPATQLARAKRKPSTAAVRDAISKSKSIDELATISSFQARLASAGCVSPRSAQAGEDLVTVIDTLRWLRDHFSDLQAK